MDKSYTSLGPCLNPTKYEIKEKRNGEVEKSNKEARIIKLSCYFYNKKYKKSIKCKEIY